MVDVTPVRLWQRRQHLRGRDNLSEMPLRMLRGMK
jgi:hypothetical protein